MLTMLILLLMHTTSGFSKPIINVGVIQIGEPIGFIDPKTNLPSGVYWDISKEIEKRSGLEFNIKLVPFKRVLQSLQSGEIDFSIFFKNPKVEDDVFLVGLVQKRPVGIISKRSSIPSLQDFKGKTIGLIGGAKYNQEFDNASYISKYELKDYDIGMKMLKVGRLDGMIGSLANLYEYARIHQVKIGKPLILKYKEAWLQFSKKSKNLKYRPQIEKALKQAYDHDKFFAIHKKYMPSYGDLRDLVQQNTR